MGTADAEKTALARGIGAVGVGRRGSRDLDDGLIRDLIQALIDPLEPAIQKGAFLGAVFAKGIAEPERALSAAFPPGVFDDPHRLAHALAPDAPADIQSICADLLKGGTLSSDQAAVVSRFLFGSDAGEGARGLIASALRVRYETPDELAALLSEMQRQVNNAPLPEKSGSSRDGQIVQIAEPFDGAENCYLLTPLIARHLEERGHSAVIVGSANPGPKAGVTVLDLAAELESSDPLENHAFGTVFRQSEYAPALERWVERRRLLGKRPFLSVLEKFMNPAGAKILIASAFHGPYLEKMSDLAVMAGFPASIIIRKGQEGTLAFSLSKPVEILCQVKDPARAPERHVIQVTPELVGVDFEEDGRLPNVTAPANAALIRSFALTGSSGLAKFDIRARYTLAGIESALTWVLQRIPPTS
ncbi:MAG: hypothetical protein HY042_13230 [Spirochaetia bacterium]|nr:hypothetical protein [Spirochaetia bacterium]